LTIRGPGVAPAIRDRVNRLNPIDVELKAFIREVGARAALIAREITTVQDVTRVVGDGGDDLLRGGCGGFLSVDLRKSWRRGERNEEGRRDRELMCHGLFRRSLLFRPERSVIGEDHAILLLVFGPMREKLGMLIGILLGEIGRLAGIAAEVVEFPFSIAARAGDDVEQLPIALANRPVAEEFLANPFLLRAHGGHRAGEERHERFTRWRGDVGIRLRQVRGSREFDECGGKVGHVQLRVTDVAAGFHPGAGGN